MRGALYPVVVAEQPVKQLQLGIAQAAAVGTGHADRTVVFHQQRTVRMIEQFGHVTVVLPQANQAG